MLSYYSVLFISLRFTTVIVIIIAAVAVVVVALIEV